MDVQVRNGKIVKAPPTLVDYNGAKGSLNLLDQITTYSNILRRGIK